MNYPIRRFVSVFSVFSLVLASFLPGSADAATKKVVKKSTSKNRIAMYLYNPNKRYGDEKVEITDSASRCLTASAKALRVKDLKTAKADGEMVKEEGVIENSLVASYKKYLTDLDYAWGALEAPYCGFGAFGSSAAIKSYQKTVIRARATFLGAVKKEAKS